jgi:flagellar hook-associated protein 1 FlgK
MGSTFGSLNIGLSGLTAQKLGLDTAGNNIANASTDGYHRQSVTLEAQAGGTVPAIWSKSDGTGNGVSASDVQRASDQFLQKQSQDQNALSSELTTKQQTLSAVESALGEPSNDGLQASLSTFWNSYQDVANNPTSTSARTALLSNASTVAGQFNQVSSAIGQLWTSSQQQLTALAQTATSTAQQVAALNGQIQAAANTGGDANDLEDRRDVLLKSLATQVGGTSRINADGTADVIVGGQLMVSGTRARPLGVAGASAPGDPLQSNSVQLTFTDVSPSPALTNVGGQVGGLLDAVNTTLPTLSNQLDTVAAALTSAVNTQQAAGYDQNGVAGAAIFSGVTAATIKTVTSDPTKVAASQNPPTAGVPSTDNTNALDAAALGRSANSPDAQYSAYVTSLGVQSQAMQNQSTNQQTLAQAADAALDSSTGVSIDEESTKLIQFQTAYEAAAKYISTVNDTLQSLLAMVA